jgi:hypothetical protein
MQKWQYEWFKESLAQGQVPQMLNKMGNDGWELVSVVHDGKEFWYYLKKPKQ